MSLVNERVSCSKYGGMAGSMYDILDDIVKNGVTEKTHIPKGTLGGAIRFFDKASDVIKNELFPKPEEKLGIYLLVSDMAQKTYKKQYKDFETLHGDIGRLATMTRDLQELERAKEHTQEDYALLRAFFNNLGRRVDASCYAQFLEEDD